jgi:hypothetical protein
LQGERFTVVLAKKFTRAQLSQELKRLEDDLRLKQARRQLHQQAVTIRAIDFCRRARQRTYLPLNSRYKVGA